MSQELVYQCTQCGARQDGRFSSCLSCWGEMKWIKPLKFKKDEKENNAGTINRSRRTESR
jgi:hypothetical protein